MLSNSNAIEWDVIEPYFANLNKEVLSNETLSDWLQRWSNLEKQVWEARAGLKRVKLWDATDETAQAAFQAFNEGIFSKFRIANQQLIVKLLAFIGDKSGQPQFIRRLRVEADLFRAENVALLSQISERESDYGSRVYGMTIEFEGQTLTLFEGEKQFRDSNRASREWAWRAIGERFLGERETLNNLFLDLLKKRHQLALNTGLPDYRAYRWQEMKRLDYTPDDCIGFHTLIETEVIPVARQIMEKRRIALGLKMLMPWDTLVNPLLQPSITPFREPAELEATMEGVFTHVDGELGNMFHRMRSGFLDLEMRKGKPPGGEEWFFPVTGLPCVRLETSNTSEDVSLLLHECGHAFHDYLTFSHQPLIWDADYPTEFSEFAAISMIYLVSPFLERTNGGFYTADEARRLNQIEIEEVLVRWLPFITMVDAFQHQVYVQKLDQAGQLDRLWMNLSERYMPWIDWEQFTLEQGSGWQRVGLIYEMPFYFLEYGLAHLGALILWHKALSNGSEVWQAFRTSLTLGGTLSLPQLYQAAGSQLPFDRAAIHDVMATVRTYLGL